MKKIFAIIVAMLLVLSIGLSASAAVTMSPYVFRGTEADGNTYIYHFGTRSDVNEEVGIKINGENYKAENFDSSTNTKFGIGIADPSNKLGDSYTVIPYAGETEYAPVSVNKNAETNAVFHPVYTQNYYPEKTLNFIGAYSTSKDYTTFATVTSSYITVVGRPTGDEAYSKNLLKFDLNGLQGLSNGRRVYLWLYLFGTKSIVSDTATLEAYGAVSEDYNESNPPKRDDISGPVGKVVIGDSCFTGEGINAVRVGMDVTNYIQQKLYKKELTATFFFKITDFEKEASADSANFVVYTNHSYHGTANSNKLGLLYNPTLHIVGTYDNIDDTVYPEVTFTKIGINGMWYGSSFTSRETSKYTEVNCPPNGQDNSSRLGLFQFAIPDNFTGVTKGKKIMLDFYAYRASSCSSDIELQTVGTYNEVVMTESGMSTYHIRSFEEGLLSSDILGTDVKKVSVDITDYVISKYLEGQKQFTIAYRTKYPEGVTGTSNSYAYIYTNKADEQYRPVIRYE